MDFLLEMTPGSGWLARENDRVVFLPAAESVEVAHDVIEPLLVPRETAAAFATLAGWIDTSRPLPGIVLIGVGRHPKVMGHGTVGLEVGDSSGAGRRTVVVGAEEGPVELPKATSIAMSAAPGEASGMLIEGVVRAGGFVIHVHSNDSARTSQEVLANPTPSILQLHLDEYSVEVGDGMVLGRWPYKHPDFDADLEPLILADPAVSRLHAEIVPRGPGAAIIDKSSHNGTWVVSASTGHKVRLSPGVEHALTDGDRILLGDTVITFGGGVPA